MTDGDNRLRILVIDDDDDVLCILSGELSRLGHLVDCAQSSRQGLVLTTERIYDFIFLDFKMPDGDGEWFMRNMRLTCKTKVLLLTGLLDRQVLDTMFRLGVRGYLMKPVERKELERHIEYHRSDAVH